MNRVNLLLVLRRTKRYSVVPSRPIRFLFTDWDVIRMKVPKFKFRLGTRQHLRLSGKQYSPGLADEIFNCRLSLRCDALQATGYSYFSKAQLQTFLTSLVHVVRDLKGTCELVPSKYGAVSIRVGVTDTGAIATFVEFTNLTSRAIHHTGWNATACFHCDWQHYCNPVDVACLDLPQLTMKPGQPL